MKIYEFSLKEKNPQKIIGLPTFKLPIIFSE